MANISKTDFIQYLNCPESLWLKKNKTDQYPEGEFSLFLEKLVKEGYEVEAYAKKLFPEGINLPNHAGSLQTQEALLRSKVLFQANFETDSGLQARADIFAKLPDGTFHLYEIKSSTSIKRSGIQNHIYDACFQKYVIEQNGIKVSKVSIIHPNKEYVKSGEIDPRGLLIIEDIYDEVIEAEERIIPLINSALEFVNKLSIDESSCACTKNTRSNHCDSFGYFNQNIPAHNIYQLNRISKKSVEMLINRGHLDLLDVPNDFNLNNNQRNHIESYRKGQPIINEEKIKQMLGDLVFPLHFYDYETYATAIPILDGMSPHQHLVFQVSMHSMNADGKISHYEYLSDELVQPEQMLEEMKGITGLSGTFISWNKSFENTRNRDLIKLFPHFENYLSYIIDNTFDLEDIFKESYIDYRFEGKSSIKNVLPILCPDLSYKTLEVQDGTMALDTWGRLILDPNFKDDKKATREALLSYCKLDSWAMVRIYQALLKL
jgi:CRISPR/Cas system-associated exonuclease Cas4 (RecB family)